MVQVESKLLAAGGEMSELPAEAKAFVENHGSGTALNVPISFKLPDGREVTMGDPPMPIDLLLPTLLPDSKDEVNLVGAGMASNITEVLLMIRKLDGKDVAAIADRGGLNMLAFQLGNQGLKACRAMFNKHFPPINPDTIEVIKKNN
jgi:hypothetical protein